MKPNTLNIAEVFHSIQGEGKTMGIPAVFVRLSGCNLLCEGSGWRCDTIEVWKKGRNTKFEDIIPPNYIHYLRMGAHLILTGGEPLMQQDNLLSFIKWFESMFNFFPTFEIETNGTIIPNRILFEDIVYWNVSPKLSNSGETSNRRINQLAIADISKYALEYIFKFVVSNHQDVLEIFQDYPLMEEIPKHHIVLMPAGSTNEQLAITRPIVAEACKGLGLRYCDRLQVAIWDKATGV
jgi:organic radical activating enzyme